MWGYTVHLKFGSNQYIFGCTCAEEMKGLSYARSRSCWPDYTLDEIIYFDLFRLEVVSLEADGLFCLPPKGA